MLKMDIVAGTEMGKKSQEVLYPLSIYFLFTSYLGSLDPKNAL